MGCLACHTVYMMITTTLALATLAPLAIGLSLAYIASHRRPLTYLPPVVADFDTWKHMSGHVILDPTYKGE